MSPPPEDSTAPKRVTKPISTMTNAEWDAGMRQAWNRELTIPINSLTEFVTKIASFPLSSETGEEPSKFDQTIEAAREFVAKIKSEI